MSNTSAGTISIDLELNDAAFNRALTEAEGKAALTGKTIDSDLAGATSRTEARFASFGSVATKALAVTGIAAAVAGVAAVKMSGDFEQSLNVFQSVSGATAKQMELVSQKAIALGNDVSLPGISARDAALALTELAKAGLTVNDSLAASKGVLSLAKAGNLDVADAASIAAKALNAFGLAGSQAATVADLLAAAANSSSADVSDIALGLAQVGAGAKQMGVNLSDTITSLALFSNAGLRGQDAGTSLKQMFIQLAAPTKQASDLMKQLGLNFFDAQGNFIGLEQTSGQLQEKLKGLTTEQRNNALATIFGSDSMRVAAILADQGATGFDKMAKAVGKQGAATELAAAQNAGFKGALDNFLSTLQTIGIDLGTKVLPPLTNFLKVMSQQLPAAVQFVSDHISELGAAVAGIGAAFLVIKLGPIVADFITMAGALRNATGAAAAFSAALDANPIGLIALAVATLVAAFVFLQVKFDIFGNAFRAIKPILDPVIAALRETGQILRNLLAPVFKLVSDNARILLNVLGILITITLAPLVAAFVPVVIAIAAVVAAILVLPTVLRFVIGLIQEFGNFIGTVFAGIAAVYNTTLKPVFDAIAFVLQALFSIWFSIFTAIYTVTFTVLSTIVQIIGVVLLGLATFVFNTFLKPVYDAWVSTFTAIARFLGPILRSIGDTISGSFEFVKAKIVGPISDALNTVRGIASQFIAAGASIISGIVTGVSNGSGAVVNKIKEICAQSLNAVKNFFGIHSPSSVMAGVGENLMKGLAEGIAKAGSLATDAMTGVSADLQKALSVPTGSFNLSTDASGAGAGSGGRTLNQSNVYNVYNQVDPSLIANDVAWRAQRA